MKGQFAVPRFETIALEIPCSHRFVTVARKAVEAVASRVQMSEDELADVKLAVGEACTNAIKFCDANSRAVSLQYRLASDRLEIEVRNSGDGFSLDKYCAQRPPVLSPHDLSEGGMGIFLMENLMDEVDISSTDGSTVVRMVKLLKR